MVRICSNRIIEFLSKPSKSLIKVCVGNFALVCIRLVMGATMTVGLCLLPTSFEMISKLLFQAKSMDNLFYKSCIGLATIDLNRVQPIADVLSALITVFMAIPLHRSLAVAEQKMKITASIPCDRQ